jgi:hypothetical protein
MNNVWWSRAGIVLLVITAALAWAFIPAVNLFINHSIAALASLDQPGH